MVLSTARKPEGGFQFISIEQLCVLWCAYREAVIPLIDVRVWFAAQEVLARRCQITRGQQPTYRQDELARLVNRVKGVSASLQRLHAHGLHTWESHALLFYHSTPEHLLVAVAPM